MGGGTDFANVLSFENASDIKLVNRPKMAVFVKKYISHNYTIVQIINTQFTSKSDSKKSAVYSRFIDRRTHRQEEDSTFSTLVRSIVINE